MSAPADPTAACQAAAKMFARDYIAPHAEAWNAAGSVPREFFTAAGRIGLCGLLVPRAAGGSGLAPSAFLAVLEVLARQCLASTFALVVHNNLAASVARHGSQAQRGRYLGAMLAGECIGAFLLTEPGVGSDAQAITTRARAQGEDWVIDGEKAWISNAVHADLLCVYAHAGELRGAPGMVALLVDADHPGVARCAAYDLLGGHALGTGGFNFRECRVSGDAVLHAPGQAFRAALGGIDLARAAVAAMCCGMLGEALDHALDYVARRPAFGGMVGDLQAVQFTLADCATDLAAARALTTAAGAALEVMDGATLAAAHAKKFATRVAFTRIADCMQVMGAAGLERTRPLARHLVAAKIAQYLDGATEVQNLVIARALAARPKAPAGA